MGKKFISWNDYLNKKYEDLPHEVCELMCVRCYHRYIGVFPERILLRSMHCPACNETGYIIKTGQTIREGDDEL